MAAAGLRHSRNPAAIATAKATDLVQKFGFIACACAVILGTVSVLILKEVIYPNRRLQAWRRSRMVCYDFINTKCSRGENCKFAHKSEWKPKKICRDFRIGNCTRQESCMFSHDMEAHRQRRQKDKKRQKELIERKKRQHAAKESRVNSLTSSAKSLIERRRRGRFDQDPPPHFSESCCCNDDDIEADEDFVTPDGNLEIQGDEMHTEKGDKFFAALDRQLKRSRRPGA